MNANRLSRAAVVLLALSVWSCKADGAEAPLTTQIRDLMHTKVTIAIADERPASELTVAFDDAFSVFVRVEEVMNEWRKDSPLWTVNAQASTAPVQAPSDLCDVVIFSLDASKRTGGLFDPTWAALRGLWRFGDSDTFAVPADAAIAERCGRVGAEHVKVVRPSPGGKCTIAYDKEGVALGLGGIAKGWGVDQAVARLRLRGLKNFFVQAGGDLYAAGKRGSRPWRVGIRDPRGARDSFFAKLEVEDAAFSTSGDYEHFAVVDGQRYHHIIDLRTCRPASGARSSTILAKSARDAEILTKSTFVLGPAKGLELAESFGAGAVIVDPSGKVHVSKSLEGRLQITTPFPTAP